MLKDFFVCLKKMLQFKIIKKTIFYYHYYFIIKKLTILSIFKINLVLKMKIKYFKFKTCILTFFFNDKINRLTINLTVHINN